jgi:hypothetical protein
MRISSLRGAFSCKAVMNFPTSAIYCLCKCIRYSVVLSFMLTNSGGTQQFYKIVQLLYLKRIT